MMHQIGQHLLELQEDYEDRIDELEDQINELQDIIDEME